MTTNLKSIVDHLAVNMTSVLSRHVGPNRFLAQGLLPQTFPQWQGKSCVTSELSGRQGYICSGASLVQYEQNPSQL